jgi:hypothetical protein
MPNIKYVSSDGVEFNLLSFDSTKLKKADFHKVSWAPETLAKQYGTVINRFTKSAQTYDCTFYFKGNAADRKTKIDDFIYQTEKDIAVLKPGRIYWDEQYIEAYLTVHDTHPVDDGKLWTEIVGQFYCAYPFWIEEKTLIIRPSEQSTSGLPDNVKGFPEDRSFVYGYEYAYPYAGTAVAFTADSALSSNFRAIIYGPCTDVQFFIAGHKYKIDYGLRNEQYMVIDTRDYLAIEDRCYVVSENGSHLNVFDYRDPESLLFHKIPPGPNVLNYARTYGIDLTLFQERSAPK